MQDEGSWRDLHGGWERLKWSRLRWQRQAGAVNGTANDAATSLGIKPGTYRAYERPPSSSKHTPLDHQSAIRFARRFRVNWIWLLLGDGTPFDDQLTPEQERAIKAMSEMDAERQATIADLAETLARRRTGTGG